MTVCYKANPEAQRKWVEERLPNLIEKAINEGAKILWQDEVTFQIRVDNGYSWGERGKALHLFCHFRQNLVIITKNI